MTSIHNGYPMNRSSGSSSSTSGSSGTPKPITANTSNINLRGRTESPSAQRKYNTGQVASMINRLTTTPTMGNTQRPVHKTSAQISTTPTSNYEYYGNNGNVSNGYLNKPASLISGTRRSSFKSLITDDPDETVTKTVNKIKTTQYTINNSNSTTNNKNEIDTRTTNKLNSKYTSYYPNVSQPAASPIATTKDLSENFHLLDLNKAFQTNGINTYVSNTSSNISSPSTIGQSINDYASNNNSMRANQSSSSTRQANLKLSVGIRTGSASSTTNENDYSRSQNGVAEFYAPTAANIITSSSSSSSYKSTNQMPSSSSLSSSSSTNKYNEQRPETNLLESKGMVGLKNLGNTVSLIINNQKIKILIYFF